MAPHDASRTPANTNFKQVRMRIEGTLTKWNDDRGFGFITPSQGGPEVFVHVSAFPHDGRRPAVGEKLTFEIETDGMGKKRAKNLLCPHRPAAPRRIKASSTYSGERPSLISRVLPLVLVGALAAYGYGVFSRPAPSSPHVSEQISQESLATYRCDGRAHCSQMTSCEEASYFLRHCPNVKMDGDHDGVPCEEQWCTGPLAR